MNENYRELNSEELEQINGGFTIGGARITKARLGERGSAVTADNRFDALAGLSVLQMQQMDPKDPLYPIAMQYLRQLEGGDDRSAIIKSGFYSM